MLDRYTCAFSDVMLDEFIVMPNHIHGIVAINRTNKPNPVGRITIRPRIAIRLSL